MTSVHDIRQKLSKLSDKPKLDFRKTPLAEHFDALTPAAVLIPLTQTGDMRMDVVLTERSKSLNKHAGEISFPGGRQDHDDTDLIHTALRESHEEIALLPSDVEIYGALLRMPTVSGYSVTVYVGEFSQPYELSPNPHEIETLIQAPLLHFAAEGIHRVEDHEWNDMKIPIHFFDYEEHLVWGATGFMLYTLLQYLGLRP